eukprot:g46497.t1
MACRAALGSIALRSQGPEKIYAATGTIPCFPEPVQPGFGVGEAPSSLAMAAYSPYGQSYEDSYDPYSLDQQSQTSTTPQQFAQPQSTFSQQQPAPTPSSFAQPSSYPQQAQVQQASYSYPQQAQAQTTTYTPQTTSYTPQATSYGVYQQPPQPGQTTYQPYQQVQSAQAAYRPPPPAATPKPPSVVENAMIEALRKRVSVLEANNAALKHENDTLTKALAKLQSQHDNLIQVLAKTMENKQAVVNPPTPMVPALGQRLPFIPPQPRPAMQPAPQPLPAFQQARPFGQQAPPFRNPGGPPGLNLGGHRPPQTGPSNFHHRPTSMQGAVNIAAIQAFASGSSANPFLSGGAGRAGAAVGGASMSFVSAHTNANPFMDKAVTVQPPTEKQKRLLGGLKKRRGRSESGSSSESEGEGKDGKPRKELTEEEKEKKRLRKEKSEARRQRRAAASNFSDGPGGDATATANTSTTSDATTTTTDATTTTTTTTATTTIETEAANSAPAAPAPAAAAPNGSAGSLDALPGIEATASASATAT